MAKKIGVDLGGTSLRAGVIEKNKVLRYVSKSTPKTQKELLDAMVSAISECMSEDITGIGIASPGPLKNGIIYNPPNLPFRNFNLQKFLQGKFSKPVKIENDAHCVALAELKLGVKKKNFIVLTLGTGIGGGIIINGEMYEGRGEAGEMGHIVVHDGKFLEILWQESREKSKGLFEEKFMIKDLYKMKDTKAKSILEEMYVYLGQAIGSYINIFDPEVFVITGGPREAGERFLKPILKETKKYVTLPTMPPVQWSKLDYPGMLGAGLLVE